MCDAQNRKYKSSKAELLPPSMLQPTPSQRSLNLKRKTARHHQNTATLATAIQLTREKTKLTSSSLATTTTEHSETPTKLSTPQRNQNLECQLKLSVEETSCQPGTIRRCKHTIQTEQGTYNNQQQRKNRKLVSRPIHITNNNYTNK